MTNRWKHYQKQVPTSPHPLVVEAVSFVRKVGSALDLGAGNLRDSYFLKERGFDVTAVDSTRYEWFPGVRFKKVTFQKYAFPENYFDLVNAQLALQFMWLYDFEEVWPKVLKSLAPGGIFTGDLFGVDDPWRNDPTKNFHTKQSVLKLLEGMEIIRLKEVHETSPMTGGGSKPFHLFEIIARKPDSGFGR